MSPHWCICAPLDHVGHRVPRATKSETQVSAKVVRVKADLDGLFYYAIHAACVLVRDGSVTEVNAVPCVLLRPTSLTDA